MSDSPPRPGALRLEIAYEGGAFHGWQAQHGVRTVQGTLEATLAQIAQRPLKLSGASRTDAGVHALGQVASLPLDDLPPRLNLHALHRGLTALLPHDVAVLRMEVVTAPAQDGGLFHARFCARGKRYRYAFWPWRVPHPLHHRTAWHLRGAPSPDGWLRALEAAQCLLGEHDFAGFRAADCDARSTVRELTWLRLGSPAQTPYPAPGEPLLFEIEGSAFLKNMVRILAGTLFDVARGAKPPDTFLRVLRSRDRTLAGQTAPAQGLTLDTLFYPDHPWQTTPYTLANP